MNLVLSSKPEDFSYNDDTGIFFLKSDVSLRIIFERGEESHERFHEQWVTKFPDPKGRRQPVYIDYGKTRILEIPCACVDGGRHVIPLPQSTTNLTLTPFRHRLGYILNHHIRGRGFDYALSLAGITVLDRNSEPSAARNSTGI